MVGGFHFIFHVVLVSVILVHENRYFLLRSEIRLTGMCPARSASACAACKPFDLLRALQSGELYTLRSLGYPKDYTE